MQDPWRRPCLPRQKTRVPLATTPEGPILPDSLAEVGSTCALGSAWLGRCAVTRDAPEDRNTMGNLPRICEACFPNEYWNPVSDVVLQALRSVEQPSDQPLGEGVRASKVK